MKITYHNKEITVSEAITDKLYPDAYSYEGELEKLKCHIGLQSELIAKLVTALCDNGNIKVEQLDEILGYGYTVEV